MHEDMHAYTFYCAYSYFSSCPLILKNILFYYMWYLLSIHPSIARTFAFVFPNSLQGIKVEPFPVNASMFTARNLTDKLAQQRSIEARQKRI